MRTIYLIARILLGLLFLVMGTNGFLMFMPPPPASTMPHNVQLWNTVFFASHYMWMTSAVQVIAGILLLINRYTFFALVLLAAMLTNILTFHITMWPQTIPMALLALVLWVLAAIPLLPYWKILFTAKPMEANPNV